MFFHEHPYEIYIPSGTRKLIIGTLPPPRFSQKKLKPQDVDFCYGSCDGMLWPVLDQIYKLSLIYDNSLAAVEQRKQFLIKENIGICDIVASCRRKKIDASDLGMQDIVLRDIVKQLLDHPTIDTLIFTGGNSKNGPEYFFRRQLKEYGLSLSCVSANVPKVHSFELNDRLVKTISLTSPSNAANRSIGSSLLYKTEKAVNPNYTTFDFRVQQYTTVFRLQSQP